MKTKPADLGEMITVFHGQRLSRRAMWFIFLGYFVILVLSAYTIWQFYAIFSKFGWIAAFYRVQPWFMLLYLFVLFLTTYVLYRIWAAKRFVEIHETGLRLRIKGIKTHQISWSDVDGIASAAIQKKFLNKSLGYEYKTVVYNRQGDPFVIDDRIEHLPDLDQAIKKQYYPFIYPDILDKYHSGEGIKFGPIMIQNQSILIAKSLPPMEFLESPYQIKTMRAIDAADKVKLSVHSGILVVKSGNSLTKRIPVSQVPNFEVLLKLFEQGVVS